MLVAGDSATVAASQLPDGACRMCQLQISHYVRLDAQGDAVFSEEAALTRSVATGICHSLVPALKPRSTPEASPAADSARSHRHEPSYPTLPGPSWPGYSLVPPAGALSRHVEIQTATPCDSLQVVHLTCTPLALPCCLATQASLPMAC